MSHRPSRHQRRPSQSHFVLPDNLSDPFPNPKPADAGDQTRAAVHGAAAAAPPGVPLPAPPAKAAPGGEAVASDGNHASKAKEENVKKSE